MTFARKTKKSTIILFSAASVLLLLSFHPGLRLSSGFRAKREVTTASMQNAENPVAGAPEHPGLVAIQAQSAPVQSAPLSQRKAAPDALSLKEAFPTSHPASIYFDMETSPERIASTDAQFSAGSIYGFADENALPAVSTAESTQALSVATSPNRSEDLQIASTSKNTEALAVTTGPSRSTDLQIGTTANTIDATTAEKIADQESIASSLNVSPDTYAANTVLPTSRVSQTETQALASASPVSVEIDESALRKSSTLSEAKGNRDLNKTEPKTATLPMLNGYFDLSTSDSGNESRATAESDRDLSWPEIDLQNVFRRIAYPAAMRRQNIEESFEARVFIDEEGNIQINIPDSVRKPFRDAVFSAFKGIKAKAATLGGKAVNSVFTLPVNFVLE